MGQLNSVSGRAEVRGKHEEERLKEEEEEEVEDDVDEEVDDDDDEEGEAPGGSPPSKASTSASTTETLCQVLIHAMSLVRVRGTEPKVSSLGAWLGFKGNSGYMTQACGPASRKGEDFQGLALCLCPEQDPSPEAAVAIHRSKVQTPSRVLPPELLDRIRACLPFTAYFRAALVSKSWQQSTFSPRMLNLCWDLHPPEPWLFALCMGDYYSAYIFDSRFCRWRNVKLPPMAQNLVQLVAAHNGLICANAYAKEEGFLAVNPIRGTSRALPRCNIDRFDPVVGLSVDMDTRSFKIVVVGSYEAEAWTEVYDSVSNKWAVTCRLPPQRRLALACCVFCKGHFYCWTAGPPEALLVYDLEQNTWTEVSISLPLSYAYGKLVEYQNRVLLVGLSQGSNAFKSVSIWEFRGPNKDMDEIARMPYGIFKDFSCKGKSRLVYYVVSSGDLLYFYAKGNPRLVICNLMKWPAQWMQLEPSDPFCLEKTEINLFSFCLHASVVNSL